MVTEPPVLFLLGPTACGKTAASLQLAEQLDGEIVSVDSSLVYRQLDIGTAKPGQAERRRVAHHLIDICDPQNPYSVARFCADALAAIADIQSRGRLPLLTGGTMLYFNALEHGLAPLPAADPELRQALAEEAAQRGWPALHAELAKVDPIAAARIHVNDPQRLQRALEVYRLTGEPLSRLQQKTEPLLACKPVKFALMPASRQWLHKRIALRFQAMLTRGLLDEVRALRGIDGMHAELPAMRSVGYRQAWQHLNGEYNEATLVERGIAATRQLAKRQMTWMRGMRGLHTVPCDTLPEAGQVRSILKTLASDL